MTSGSDPMIGTRLDGQFDLLELLGKGGMGRVYKALQHPLGRTVAVKIMARGDGQPGSLAPSRFLREAKAASRLSHPNIVTIHAFGETPDGWLYLVMERVVGRTLAAVMDEEAPMDLVRASKILEQVAGALSEAHAAGILHRDLKPTNIMLTRVAGREEVVKLLDFGLAKAFVADESLGSITADDVVVGTSGYLAPEQIRCEPLDPRTDVWALAVLMYRATTGRLPFMGDKAEVIHRTLDKGPPPPSVFNPGLPEEAERVILWGLNKDPRDRPASVFDLARAFAAAAGAPFELRSSQVGTVPSQPIFVPRAVEEDEDDTDATAMAVPRRSPDRSAEASHDTEADPESRTTQVLPAPSKRLRNAIIVVIAAVASAALAGTATWLILTR